MAIRILYEDKWLCLCVKEPGILSESSGMPELLGEQCGQEHFPVHRLDRAVGGLMVYARDSKSAGRLSALVAERSFEKEYLAVLPGRPPEPEGVLKDLLFKDSAKNKSYVVQRMRKGVKEASLAYRVLEEQDGMSLVSVQLHTGRSHQIRVQFSSRGLPLLGDVKYGSRHKDCPIALWSHRLAFSHPMTGKHLDYSVLPPKSGIWQHFSYIQQEVSHE